MTLADLAALAAKVERFQRPKQFCPKCGGTGQVERSYLTYKQCQCEVFPGWEWDNSPAALAMAVLELPGHAVEKYPKRLYVSLDGGGSGCYGASHDGTTESIVRALLTALLRVYEVDVPSE